MLSERGHTAEFELYYAAVLEREAAARVNRNPQFSAELLRWAAAARARAAAIAVQQGDLFA